MLLSNIIEGFTVIIQHPLKINPKLSNDIRKTLNTYTTQKKSTKPQLHKISITQQDKSLHKHVKHQTHSTQKHTHTKGPTPSQIPPQHNNKPP